MILRCPVCGESITAGDKVWRCAQGHCFDVARQGYVNLLPVQQKHSLHPGDTPDQVHARRRFLSAGFYTPIAEAACELLGSVRSLLDVGCGEGYYLRQFGQANPGCERWGLDISRDAVRLAAGADKAGRYLVATAAHLPFADGSFDAIMSLFALTLPEEYFRVLRHGGRFLQALAAPDHLRALKELIYPELTQKPKTPAPELPGFVLEERRVVQFDIMLTENGQVADLLAMTPHYWRITREGALRVARTERLRDTAHVFLNLYRRTE